MTRLSSGSLWRRRQERWLCQETLAHSACFQPPQTCAALDLTAYYRRGGLSSQGSSFCFHSTHHQKQSVLRLGSVLLCAFVPVLMIIGITVRFCYSLHKLNGIACLEACRLMTAETVWTVKNEDKHDRISWVILSVGLRRLTGCPAKSIFIHPVDYGTVGEPAPQYRGQKKAMQVAVLHVEHQEFLARLISLKNFFLPLIFYKQKQTVFK